jgi:hypothetical protein
MTRFGRDHFVGHALRFFVVENGSLSGHRLLPRSVKQLSRSEPPHTGDLSGRVASSLWQGGEKDVL